MLRLSLSFGFLSAVASRLGLLGAKSSGWSSFLDYTEQVNSFLPKSVIPPVAVTSTVLETSIAIMLLAGLKQVYAALGASFTYLTICDSNVVFFWCKEALDYSVFAFLQGIFISDNALLQVEY